MHAPRGKAGRATKNARYGGATPRDAQQWLCAMWARARAKLARLGVTMYGFRVAEPHHDGCPHWHALIWFKDQGAADQAAQVVRDYWLSDDGHERGAAQNRVNVKAMQAGGAAGYIAKYIAKNVGFLSCLCGSEHIRRRTPLRALFLSCLCGSERLALIRHITAKFLSCLCGSEPTAVPTGTP